MTIYCPYCSIVIYYYEIRHRKCNNCSHEFEIYHVLPVNDTKIHFESCFCHCHPEIEYESGNMVVVHNSFDGREGVEWANEILI